MAKKERKKSIYYDLCYVVCTVHNINTWCCVAETHSRTYITLTILHYTQQHTTVRAGIQILIFFELWMLYRNRTQFHIKLS